MRFGLYGLEFAYTALVTFLAASFGTLSFVVIFHEFFVHFFSFLAL